MVTTRIDIKNLNIWFGDTQPLKNLSIKIYANEILSIIGPANSGKTTFLRMLNRLNELESNFKMTGQIEFDNRDIMKMDIELLRKES